MPRFGIELIPNRPFHEMISTVKQAEQGGFEYVWITDHFNNRNVYVTLTQIASNTKKVILGPGVTNPYTFNPIIIAQSIASINEVAPGRVVLGIGAGDPSVLAKLGLRREKTLKAIRESVKILRSVLEGKGITIEGDVFTIRGARLSFEVKEKIPIYIGAQGPNMLRLAGEIGDGVLVNASHPEDVRYALSKIGGGAEAAGKKIGDVDIAACAAFSVHKDPEKAKDAVKPVVAFILAGAHSDVLQRHNIDVSTGTEARKALKTDNWRKALDLVTDQILDAFSIYGTPHNCLDRIDDLVRLGIDQLVIGSPIGPDINESVELISKRIIPELTAKVADREFLS